MRFYLAPWVGDLLARLNWPLDYRIGRGDEDFAAVPPPYLEPFGVEFVQHRFEAFRGGLQVGFVRVGHT